MASHVSIKDISEGQVLKCQSKKDPSVKFKVKVISRDIKNKTATLEALDGSSAGKTLNNITEERLFRNQGRQPGTSPAKKVAPTAPAKETVKPNKSKDTAKVKAAEVEEDMDPESARQELIEMAEDITEILARIEAIANFLGKIEVKEADDSPEEDEEGEEGASPSPSPEPAKRRRRSSKPMNTDSDEE